MGYGTAPSFYPKAEEMHDTAIEIGKKFFEIHGRAGQLIVEIGSKNVNGTLRNCSPDGATYLGIDVEAGPGVDIFVSFGKPIPVRSDFADIVVSSSVFEHDPCFWETFVELARLLKPGGILYLNAPSNGSYHRYPVDCWRFYPDCGRAFEELARRNGYELTLIESFIAERKADMWNDFVAIFVKASHVEREKIQFVSDHIACTNVVRLGMERVLSVRVMTQDMIIIKALRDEIIELKRAKPSPATDIVSETTVMALADAPSPSAKYDDNGKEPSRSGG